jgi:hypothetical protein
LTTPLDTFDPYRDWLGIAPHELPADHYRLLGLKRFEADAGRIAAAADERMALVRSFQVGPRRAFTQKLLNELSAARVCLLSAATKATYDASLHDRGVSRAGLQPAVDLRAPAAPPVQPPPPPERQVKIDSGEQPATLKDIAPPAPWWRPLVSMLAMALLVLAAAIGWGIYQAIRPPSGIPVPEAPTSMPEPEVVPEPLPPQAVVQVQEGSREINLAPATAMLQGNVELRPAGTEEILGGFTTASAAAQWQFQLFVPGFFALELQYATAAEVEAASLVVEVAGATKLLDLRPTGGLDQFHTDTFTFALPKSGQHSLLLKPADSIAGEGLILKSVRLVPVDTGLEGERGGPPP